MTKITYVALPSILIKVSKRDKEYLGMYEIGSVLRAQCQSTS